MDYKALALDAWSITRHTRALWWLGLVSAAQVVVYTAIVVAVTGPLAVLPQLVVAPVTTPTPVEIRLQSVRESALVVVTDWLAMHGTALLAGVVAVFVVWIVLGVLDVAAQSGLISQALAPSAPATAVLPTTGTPTAAAGPRAGQRASFRAGMHDGFRVWWRVVGLLAVAALPGLFSMLVMAIVVLFTMTLPLLRGAAPDPGAALAGNVILSPLSSLAALVGIPLGVAVQLGMRDAVLSDADWRTAFSAGWRLLRTRFGDVAVAYLVVAIVGVAVTLLAGVVLAVIGVPTMAFAFATGGGSGATAIASGMFVLAVVLMLVLLPLAVLNYVWASCFLTLFWQRLTGWSRGRATMASGQSTTLN